MKKPVRLTRHAEDNLLLRNLPLEWIVRAIEAPDRIAPDPRGPGYTRRYRILPEAGERIIRVVCFEDATEIRVLTAFLDRVERRRSE